MRTLAAALLLSLASPITALADWLPGGTPVTPPPSPAPYVSFLESSLPSAADGQGGVYVFHVRSLVYTYPWYTTGYELYAHRLDAQGNVPPGWAAGVALQGWGEIAGYTWYNPLTTFQGPGGTAQAALAWPNDLGGEPNTRLARCIIQPDATVQRIWGFSTGHNPLLLPVGDGGVIFAAITDPHAPIGQTPPPPELYLGRENSGAQPLWFGLTLAPASEVLGPVVLALDGANGCYVAWVRTDGSLLLHRALENSTLSPDFPAAGLVVATQASAPRLVEGPAGSVYVLWQDTRSGTAVVYLTRVLPDGTPAPGWPLDGVPAGPGTSPETLSECDADGLGGVLITFDTPPGTHRLTRFDANGARHAGWSGSGLVLHPTPTTAPGTTLLADGLGGAFAAFQNGSAGDADRGLYATHILGDGSLAPGNVPGGTLLEVQGTAPSLVSAGVNAIVTWVDVTEGIIRAQQLSGDGPVATELSLIEARADVGVVSLAWQVSGAGASTFRLERRAERGDWVTLATLTSDGSALRYEDRDVEPLARYDYRLRWTEDGAEQVGGEVSVAVPATSRFAIETARPNPASDGATIGYTLPTAGRVRVDVIDLAGRVALSRSLAGAAGRQTFELPEVARLAAGLYVVRLEHDGSVVRGKLMVVR